MWIEAKIPPGSAKGVTPKREYYCSVPWPQRKFQTTNSITLNKRESTTSRGRESSGNITL
jgi:hypothetical protein